MTRKVQMGSIDDRDASRRIHVGGLEADVTPQDDGDQEETAIEVIPEATGGAQDNVDAAREAPPPAAEPLPEEALARAREQLLTMKAERDRLYDAWLRTTADFENSRKRTERERDEFRQCAIESLLLQLLPVLDNFERALESLPPGMQRGFAEGVNLIYKQFGDLLAKHGVTPIQTEGEMFDPHLHEAVETEARNDVPHHRILCERQRGYKLGNRVIRPARVKVSVRGDDDRAEATQAAAEEIN